MAKADATDLNDHDLLIRIDERQQKVEVCMRNHLAHHVRLEAWHRRLVLIAFGVSLAALLSSIGWLIAAAVANWSF